MLANPSKAHQTLFGQPGFFLGPFKWGQLAVQAGLREQRTACRTHDAKCAQQVDAVGFLSVPDGCFV